MNTNNRTIPWRRMTPRFQVIGAIYFAIGFAYFLYGMISGAGLYGYVEKAELDLFGAAQMKMTVYLTLILTAILFLLVFMAITALLGKLDPSLVWNYANTPSQSKFDIAERMSRSDGRLSWPIVKVAGALPVLIGAIVSLVMFFSAEGGPRVIYPIDAASNAAGPPPDARFVEVTGRLARPHTVGLKRTTNSSVKHELFVPIVEEKWTPGDPIRYFVHHVVDETWDHQVDWPEPFHTRGIARFSGKIGGALPPYVEGRFRSKGLTLARAYSVIEWQPVETISGPPPSWRDTLIPLGVGLMISAFLFLILTPALFVSKWAESRKLAS